MPCRKPVLKDKIAPPCYSPARVDPDDFNGVKNVHFLFSLPDMYLQIIATNNQSPTPLIAEFRSK